jgi:SNF2 family DNA or RNA helicase
MYSKFVVFRSLQLCPFCREPYEENDQITLSVAQAAAKNKKKKKKIDVRQAAEEVVDEVAPKIKALLEAIGEMASDEKAVIFSQWTSYLDVIQNALEAHGHTFTRIDGTMKPLERIEAMEDFSMDEEDSPRFILCSLHACGVGINLTRGNVVFVLDPWWNSAVENQAMDRYVWETSIFAMMECMLTFSIPVRYRVHRIGQTRPVRAIRFIMENSLEERMVTLQDSKAALGKGSLQKLNKEERKKARITALKDLFEITAVQAKWHGYVEDDDDEGGDLGGFIVGDDVED